MLYQWKAVDRHDPVLSDMVDVGVIADVGEVEKDVDLGGLQAQLLGGMADLAPVDGRAVGRDAEIPHRLALLGGIARHQSREAFLVGRSDGLDEGIADDEDGRPVLVGFAGRAGADPESVAIRLPGIDDVAPGPVRFHVWGQIVMIVGRYVGLHEGGRRVGPVALHVGEHGGQKDVIEGQGDHDDGEDLTQDTQHFFHLKACLRCRSDKQANPARPYSRHASSRRGARAPA